MSNQTSRITVYINDAEVSKAYATMEVQQKKLTDAIKKGQAAGKDMTKEMERLSAVSGKMDQLRQVMDGKIRPSLQMMAKEVSRVHKELSSMSADAPGYAAKLEEFRKKSAIFSEMKAQVSGVKNEMGGMKSAISSVSVALGAGIAMAASSALTAVKSFISDSITEAREAEKSVTRLKNILGNLGRADAFDRLSASADKMAEKFKHLDNDDILEVFTQLITYGKLTENQMQDLMPVIIDFAAKSGMSVNDSAAIFIKALEGNSKALKEYGIDMREGGTVTERLGILMTDLKGRVEGSAEAFGTTMDGEAAIAEQRLRNIQEVVGNQLIPVLTKLYQWAASAIQGLSEFGAVVSNIFEHGIVGGIAKTGADEAMKKRAAFITQSAKDLIFNLDTEERKKAGIVSLNKSIESFEKNLEAARKANNRAEIERWKESIEIRKKALTLLQTPATPADGNKVLGLGGDMGTPKKDPAAEKAAREAERMREQLAKVRDEMVKLETEIGMSGMGEYESKLAKINERYSEMEIRLIKAGAAQEDLDKLHELRSRELNQLQESYMDRLNVFLQENDAARQAASMSAYEKEVAAIEKLFREQERLFKGHTDALVKLEAEKHERLREARIKAEIKGLGDRIENVDLSGMKVQGIPGVQSPSKGKEDDPQKWDKLKAKAQQYITYANHAMSLISMISNFQRAADEAEMARFRQQQDEKMNALDHLKEQKIIGDEDYKKQKIAIEKETAAEERKMKRKQAEADKHAQMFQIAINTASAVIEALPNIPLSIIVGALGAVQLGMVAATPIPEFASGGFIPQGPSHQEGGLGVYNGNRKIAEIEGGEPIYSKRFYRNNKPFMDSLMAFSHATNGGSLPVNWTREIPAINVASINKRLGQYRMFADGGFLPTPESVNGMRNMNRNTSNNENRELVEMITNNTRVLGQLSIQLEQGIVAIASVSQIQEEVIRLEDIRSQGTMTRSS